MKARSVPYDIIHTLASSMIAKHCISTLVDPLKPTDSALFALTQMEEAKLSHLPVVDGTAYIGLISEKEIQGMDDTSLPVEHALEFHKKLFITEDQHFYEILQLFSSYELTLVPVVTDNLNYLGSITLETMLKMVAEALGLHQPGGVIVLEINYKDYNLSELVQIVESNDAKILHCIVTPNPESNIFDVTLKVNRIEIGSLLQALFRFNYVVKFSWSKEDAYHEGLRDRFDALMNYLSI